MLSARRCWLVFFALMLVVLLTGMLTIFFLPNLLVIDREPTPVDAILVLSGEGIRLRKGVELYDQKIAPRLILTASKKESWERAARKLCDDCQLEKWGAVVLSGSIDTRTDAQISLKYFNDNHVEKVLVVTSPYHTRRAQFVFNDIYERSGIEAQVISTGDYGKLLPPNSSWWRDQKTLEVIWLEFGKILYWELTPFMDLKGSVASGHNQG